MQSVEAALSQDVRGSRKTFIRGEEEEEEGCNHCVLKNLKVLYSLNDELSWRVFTFHPQRRQSHPKTQGQRTH